jgi:opacity protein-like surface antigen
MKKYFFAVGLFFCSTVIAQQHKIAYGFQTALNINSASGNAVSSQYKSSLTGIGVGGHIQINTATHFGIKAQLQFDQNGWSYRSLTFMGTGLAPLNKGDVLYRLNYINLPVMATYSTGKKIQFTSGLGIFAGALVSDHYITKIKEPSSSSSTSKSTSSKSINFGIAAEAGIQIPLAEKLKLDITLHNNFGLANTLKNNTGYSNNIKLNTLSFQAGLTWSR